MHNVLPSLNPISYSFFLIIYIHSISQNNIFKHFKNTFVEKMNEVGYRSVVSQNELAKVFKILYIFQTAAPFSRVQINTHVYTVYLIYTQITVLICTP